MGAVLQCENLVVGYHDVPLIRDIDIRAEEGEIVTLIGPNGAGKSTVLKSITRQMKPLGGKVYLDGQDEETMSDAQLSRLLAVVLTGRTGTEYMTCRDVAAMGRYPYTGRLGILSAEDKEKVEAVLRRVGAEDYAGQEFSRISDGQRQRILLARAICQETKVMVLDEPTSFLDLHYKRSLLRLIWQEAKEHGMTVVMSLHELDLARQVSDRIICLRRDTIWKAGTPDEIFRGDTIEQLYDLPRGSYDAADGRLDLGLRE